MEFSRAFVVSNSGTLISWGDYSSLPESVRKLEKNSSDKDLKSLNLYKDERKKKMAVIFNKSTSKKLSMEKYTSKPSYAKKSTCDSVNFNDFLQSPILCKEDTNKFNESTLSAMRNRNFSMKSWQL